MSMGEIALRMWPYWAVGFSIIGITLKSKYKNLLEIKKESLVGFFKFLGMLTIYRLFMFTIFKDFFSGSAHVVSQIPIFMTLLTPWEDATHGLPLLILQKVIGTKKWTWPIHGIIMAVVMLHFLQGHLYQGLIPACMLSLYIPISIHLAKKHGYGTVMLCHIVYDFSTILTMRIMLGS
jgi:hypothetical protein